MIKQKTVYFRQAGRKDLQELILPIIGPIDLMQVRNIFAGNNVEEWICPFEDGVVHYKEMTKEELLEEYGGVLSADQVDEILNN